MVLLDKATKAFRAIPNIGITPDIRPEEAKHIRYLNIGFSLMIFINLSFFLKGLIGAKHPAFFFWLGLPFLSYAFWFLYLIT